MGNPLSTCPSHLPTPTLAAAFQPERDRRRQKPASSSHRGHIHSSASRSFAAAEKPQPRLLCLLLLVPLVAPCVPVPRNVRCLLGRISAHVNKPRFTLASVPLSSSHSTNASFAGTRGRPKTEACPRWTLSCGEPDDSASGLHVYASRTATLRSIICRMTQQRLDDAPL